MLADADAARLVKTRHFPVSSGCGWVSRSSSRRSRHFWRCTTSDVIRPGKENARYGITPQRGFGSLVSWVCEW